MKKILGILGFIWIGFLYAQADTTIYHFMMVDEKPKWMGCQFELQWRSDSCGNQLLNEFLDNNLMYPPIYPAIEGKVYVSIIIEPDGKVTNVKLRKGIHSELDQEAMRVVKLLPNFIPAKKQHIPVRVIYQLPITFSLK